MNNEKFREMIASIIDLYKDGRITLDESLSKIEEPIFKTILSQGHIYKDIISNSKKESRILAGALEETDNDTFIVLKSVGALEVLTTLLEILITDNSQEAQP